MIDLPLIQHFFLTIPTPPPVDTTSNIAAQYKGKCPQGMDCGVWVEQKQLCIDMYGSAPTYPLDMEGLQLTGIMSALYAKHVSGSIPGISK